MRERVAIDGLCELLYDRAVAGPPNAPHLRCLLKELHCFPSLHVIFLHNFDKGVTEDISLSCCCKLKDYVHFKSQKIKSLVKASTKEGDSDSCLKVYSISDDLTQAIVNVDSSAGSATWKAWC